MLNINCHASKVLLDRDKRNESSRARARASVDITLLRAPPSSIYSITIISLGKQKIPISRANLFFPLVYRDAQATIIAIIVRLLIEAFG